MLSNSVTACPLRSHVDPRLTRFSAGATALVLAVALLTAGPVRPLGLGLLGSQVAIYAFTAFVSFQWSVWARIYANVIWPRVSAPGTLDDAKPHRFAQLLGFVLTALALGFFVFDADAVGYTLTAVAVVLGVLHAVTGLCMGCTLYDWLRRT